MHVSNIYTSLKTREKNMYSFQGAKISESGVSTLFIKVYFGILSGFIAIGALICLWQNKFLFNPFENDQFSPFFDIIIFGLPLVITWALISTHIQGYKTIDFIAAWIKPKYIGDKTLKRSKFTNVKTDTLIENIFF